MILRDLFTSMGGMPAGPVPSDPLDAIKGGLLARLLGRVDASDAAPGDIGSMAGFEPPGDMPAQPQQWAPPAAAVLDTPWSDQAPTAPAAPAPKWTDQAPAMPAAMTPERLPDMPVKDIAPQAGFGAPYMPPPSGLGGPMPPAAAPAGGPPVAAQSAPQAAPPFEAGVGARLRAFGRALQGADPGDPGQAAAMRNETMKFLQARGMSGEDARAMVSNPALLQAALPGLFQGRAAPRVEEIFDDQGRPQKVLLNPATGQYQKLGGAKGASDGKAPSGFEWINPNDHSQGLRAIPGGPATHMSVELSGKLALMDAAQQGITNTRETLLKPWGALGAGQALASAVPFVGDISAISGEIGIAKRNVRAGIEAALRVMTGAAAPEQEVTRYMELFMPGVRDTKESAAQKLGLLDQFMNNAREMVTRGRTATPGPGGAGNGAPGAGPQAPQGPAPARDQAVSEARAAIAAGKNPDAVRARLAQWGYSLD